MLLLLFFLALNLQIIAKYSLIDKDDKRSHLKRQSIPTKIDNISSDSMSQSSELTQDIDSDVFNEREFSEETDSLSHRPKKAGNKKRRRNRHNMPENSNESSSEVPRRSFKREFKRKYKDSDDGISSDNVEEIVSKKHNRSSSKKNKPSIDDLSDSEMSEVKPKHKSHKSRKIEKLRNKKPNIKSIRKGRKKRIPKSRKEDSEF